MFSRAKDKITAVSNAAKYDLWQLTKAGKQNYQSLQQLKDKYAGKRCFVMGNGPSLVKCDLSKLKGEVTIGSNNHFLLWEQMGYKPTFLTLEDELVAKGRSSELSALTGTTKIFPYDLVNTLIPNSDTLYINFVRKYKPFPLFTEQFADKVYWGGTVSYLNLQLAYYLGCKEVYLIGFDHSFKLPKMEGTTVITADAPDSNHFHPDYYLKGHKWYDPNVERMESAYVYAKDYLQQHGVKVYNATVGGKLEVFERIDFDKLF